MKPRLFGQMVLLAALGVVGGWISPAFACTGIRIKPKDGSVIYARTLEFALDFSSNLIVVPRHMDLSGTVPGDKPGLRWQWPT